MTDFCTKEHLLEAFSAGLKAVHPIEVAEQAVRQWDNGRPVAVVAIGKAACGLHEGAYKAIGDQIEAALIVTGESYAHDVPGNPEFCFGAHPVPDEGSLAAGARLIEFLVAQRSNRRILVMVSGGSSAMVESRFSKCRLRTGFLSVPWTHITFLAVEKI